MTVKRLIKELQKLPQDSPIIADVLGDEINAEIVRAGEFYSGDGCYITIDRTRCLQSRVRDIRIERGEE